MFAAWHELEAASRQTLIAGSGGLDLGDPEIPGSVAQLEDCVTALSDAGIEHELLDATQARQRWPQWRLREDVRILFQADAGSLDIARACAATSRSLPSTGRGCVPTLEFSGWRRPARRRGCARPYRSRRD